MIRQKKRTHPPPKKSHCKTRLQGNHISKKKIPNWKDKQGLKSNLYSIHHIRLLEKGRANHLGILALRIPWTVWKGKKMSHWKMNSPKEVGRCVQHATGKEWKKNSRKNEEMEPKWKQLPVVTVTGDGNKVWYHKTNIYCMGTWNVWFMYKGKFKVLKQ